MTRQHRIIAIEGPCCAGKTTLNRGLLAELTGLRVAHVRCYADHVGGGRHLPRAVPQSLDEDAAALRALIGIEQDRTAAALAAASDIIVMDRGTHTLLAHRYAIERLTGLACFEPARRALSAARLPSWPHLAIYLDIPQEVVLDRNNGKFPPDSIFIDATFNAAVRDYFANLAEQNPAGVAWLDATLDPGKLVSMAETRVRHLLSGVDVTRVLPR